LVLPRSALPIKSDSHQTAEQLTSLNATQEIITNALKRLTDFQIALQHDFSGIFVVQTILRAKDARGY